MLAGQNDGTLSHGADIAQREPVEVAESNALMSPTRDAAS